MNKRPWIATCLVNVVPAIALAGPLYGTVRFSGGKPLVNADVFVQCPAFKSSAESMGTPAQTDDRGSYSLRVPAAGRCQMRFRSGNKLGEPFEVLVANNPLRVDIEVDSNLNRVR